MLDPGYIYTNLADVRENCRRRNVMPDLDRVVQLLLQRKTILQNLQTHQQRQNEISKLVAKEKDSANRAKLIEEGRALRNQQAEELEPALKEVETELRVLMLTIPNLTHPDAPVGNENRVIKTWGQRRKFDFPVLDHVTLAETLDLVDFEAGSRVAGQKFYFLKNEAALLELALVQYAMGVLVRAGYTPIITPDLARVEVLEGIGFIPRGPETQIYSIANSDLCLVATAEITLGGMHAGQVLDEAQLPVKYVGLSHCFRTEAGAPGRDTRGLYRVHQFTKVEMFAFCTPEQSEDIHQEMLSHEERIFQGLGLPYQVIDTCTGDLGGPAYRKFDLEAWMPGRGQGGEYGEVTSTSNCTDYQARRLSIRYKSPGQKGTRFVHTLNGTAVACTRALLAILENYQGEDGSVIVPEALRPWAGREQIRSRRAGD